MTNIQDEVEELVTTVLAGLIQLLRGEPFETNVEIFEFKVQCAGKTGEV